MADQIEADEKDGSGQELRGKLMARLAMAASLVAVLLGVLAFFDYLATEPEEPEDEIFTKPVPVAPKKTVSQPVTPVDTSADPVVSPAPEHGGGGAAQ